jgi:hypothetical protein
MKTVKHTANSSGLQAGAGKSVITIKDEMLPLDGFVALHDSLFVRVIILKATVPAAIVSVDMTSLGDDAIGLLRSVVSDKTGIPGENIWICVTHTFSAPHLLSGPLPATIPEADRKKNDLLRDALVAAAGKAARTAAEDVREAALSIGIGSCDVNVNRDILSKDGWWIGFNAEGLSDKTLIVMNFSDLSGNQIGLIYHYGVQSSVMDGAAEEKGGKFISADLTGEASRVAEEALGGVAVFLPGASGDQAPRQKAKFSAVSEDGRIVERRISSGVFEIVPELGGELGSAVVHLARDICAETLVTELGYSRMIVRCPKQKRPFEGLPVPSTDFVSVDDGEIDTTVNFLRIGKDIMLLGVKPEINCITAMEIRKDSPFQRTLVIQMVNGGQKYMADRESYLRMTYEAMNSSFGIGAAEHLCAQVTAALREAGSGM